MRAAPMAASTAATDVAIDATLRAAALRRCAGPKEGGGAARNNAQKRRPTFVDLRRKVRQMPARQLILFVLDASDSMTARAAIAAAKGAAVALLQQAYLQRDRVAVVAFRDEEARLLLPPTASVERARRALEHLWAGGATPLPAALWRALLIAASERTKSPGTEPLLVLLSDGGANVSLSPWRAARTEALAIAAAIRQRGIRSLVIDTSPREEGAREMRNLAEALGAAYAHIEALKPQGVLAALDDARREGVRR